MHGRPWVKFQLGVNEKSHDSKHLTANWIPDETKADYNDFAEKCATPDVQPTEIYISILIISIITLNALDAIFLENLCRKLIEHETEFNWWRALSGDTRFD